MTGLIIALAVASAIGNLPYKEVPLQDPFPPAVVEEIEQERNYYVIDVVYSHYDACYDCCGKTDGITASGVKATPNHTIAAPKEYAFGTNIEINGIMYTVEDRGGAIKNNKFDIFVESHQEANNRGVGYGKAKVYL